jgi:hypothetical protein
MSDETIAIIYTPLNERSRNFRKFTFVLVTDATEEFPEAVLEMYNRRAVLLYYASKKITNSSIFINKSNLNGKAINERASYMREKITAVMSEVYTVNLLALAIPFPTV